jgi:hypothetical protein
MLLQILTNQIQYLETNMARHIEGQPERPIVDLRQGIRDFIHELPVDLIDSAIDLAFGGDVLRGDRGTAHKQYEFEEKVIETLNNDR